MALEPDALRCVTPFADLAPATLAEIAAATCRRHYRKGMLIVAAGEPSEAIHLLLAGRVRVFRSAADGHEQVLQTMSAGELLPVAGFPDGHSYPASVETLADCSVGVIRNVDFARLVRGHADLAWAVVVYMSQRLRWAQERIYDFSLRTVGARLAGTLLDLIGREGVPGSDGRYRLPALPRHREIAQLAGCTRETATRLLLAMQRDGTVRQEPDGRFIVDPERLAMWREPEDGQEAPRSPFPAAGPANPPGGRPPVRRIERPAALAYRRDLAVAR